MELLSRNEVRLIMLWQEMNNFDHGQLLEQNRDLREAHFKSLNEMQELKRLQGSTFDGFSRRKSIEDRDTTLEHTAKKSGTTE